MKEFIKKSFKRELLFAFLAVAVVPLAFSSLFLIELFRAKVSRDYEKTDAAQAARITEILTGLFSELDHTAQRITGDPEVEKAFADGEERTEREIYEILYRETANLRDLARFDLYTADGVCLYSTGSGMFRSRLPSYWGILKISAAHTYELILRRAQEEGRDPVLLQAARAVTGENGEAEGFLVADLTRSSFQTALQDAYGGQDGICILDDFYETVYSAGTASQEKTGERLRARALAGESLTETDGDNTVYLLPLGETGLTGVLLRPVVFTRTTVRSMYTVLLILTSLSFFLCLMVASRLSGHLASPILRLNRAMNEVRGGKLQTRVHMQRPDEFGELADSFDAMTECLADYMEEQVAQQKQMNEIRIAMMQAQLNPHFLYNTLDTMKWVAKANHIPEIATLAEKLAKILRTSISGNAFIPLSAETELARCYAEIQRIRFAGRFTFSFELPEELAGLLVPKLIIQPIVENAVIHGLADAEEGDVSVRAFRENQNLCIEVEDNGCGMDGDTLSYINQPVKERRKGHIGIYNVDTVLRLYYGTGFGLTAERRPEGGTRVRITLPPDGILTGAAESAAQARSGRKKEC